MESGSTVELIGVITNVDYKNKCFSVHCVSINKTFKVTCDMFCPVQKDDTIHAICVVRHDGILAVVEAPFVQPSMSKNSIVQCFIMALKCSYANASKLYNTIDRMGDTNVATTLSGLAQRWNDKHDPDILLMFGDASMDDVKKLLNWWHKQRNLRRLYLLGLNNKEINASRLTCDKIYDIATVNPYSLPAIPIEKCDSILNRLNKPVDSASRYLGQAARIIWNNLHSNAWVCTPTRFITRQFPDIMQFSDRFTTDFKMVQEYNSYYLPHPHKVEVYITDYVTKKVLDDKITYHTPLDTAIDLGDGLVTYRQSAQFTRDLAPDQQMAVQGALDHTICIVTGAAGTGKCLDPNTLVRLFNGSTMMVKDLKVGDLLMGPDSKPRMVLSTCSGVDQMYMLQPHHGNPIVCNAPHVLTLKYPDQPQAVDIPLNVYLQQHRPGLLFHQAIEYAEISVSDPYLSGFHDSILQTTISPNIVINSMRMRQQYLAGVIDCVGYIDYDCYVVQIKSDEMKETLCTLLYSLALIPEVSESHIRIHGKTKNIPTRIVRNLITSGVYKAEKEFSVKPLGLGLYAGFELTGDGRFLLADGVVTHNTTCIKEIIYNLELRGVTYAICSFTGKAVARIREVTGKKNPATMHRLISSSKKDKYDVKSDQFEKDIPLSDYEHVIIDEASMVAEELLYDFLEAYPTIKRLTLVGDCNQLAPIGWGNVLGQLVISETIPTYKLTTNYRVFTVDGETDGVILNANAIIKHNPLCAFNFVETDNFQLIEGPVERVFDIIKGCYDSGIDPADIIILSPYNKVLPEINRRFQDMYNKNQPFVVTSSGTKWCVNDRVMLTANDADIGVFNGEIGTVREITKSGIMVDFGQSGCHEFLLEPKPDRQFYQQGRTNRYYKRGNVADEVLDGDEGDAPYERTVLNLSLAYALTIDKSQGSEWQFVVLYISEFNAGSFLNRSRIYTAITRTKRCCWVVTSDIDALNMAAVKSPPVKHENLARRLTQRLPKMPPFTLPTGNKDIDMVNDYYASYEQDDEEYYD